MVNTWFMTLFCLVVYSDLDDLLGVERELIPVSTRWKSIGIVLRVSLDVLDVIQTQYSGNPQACLTSVLTEWLKRNYNVQRFGEPTWQRLVEAVGDPAGGGNMALAREIARRHTIRGMSNRYICCTLGKFHIL